MYIKQNKINVVQTYGHVRIYLVPHLDQRKLLHSEEQILMKTKNNGTHRGLETNQTWIHLIQQYYGILQKSKHGTPLVILCSFTKQVFG